MERPRNKKSIKKKCGKGLTIAGAIVSALAALAQLVELIQGWLVEILPHLPF